MGAFGDAIRVMNATEVREAIAKMGDAFDALIINAGSGNAEIVVARGNFPSLLDKLNAMKTGTPKATYNTLEELQTAHPTYDENIYLVKDENDIGYIYDWNGTTWFNTGIQYLSDGIAKGSISLDLLSTALFNSNTHSWLKASFSNARSFENAYQMRFTFTIPAGITLNTITAKIKFKTGSSNITQARMKVQVGTNPVSQYLTTPSYTTITPNTETQLEVTRSNNDTGFTTIVAYIYGYGSNIALPAMYETAELELYINGNKVDYTAVLDEAFSQVDATCTFNYSDAKIALISDIESANSELQNGINTINGNIDNINDSLSQSIKAKNVGGYKASFSNGRSFENSYPLKFACSNISGTYTTIEFKVKVTSQSDNLYRGHVKIYFGSPTSSDFAVGEYIPLVPGQEVTLSVTATRTNIQTVYVYIFLEGTNIALESEYTFKDLKILRNGVEDDTITLTNDPTYGSTDITSLTITENEQYVLAKNNGDPLNLAIDQEVAEVKERIISPLQGKKINALGDSYFAGHTLGQTVTWVYKLAAKYNMTLNNYGINGNKMTGVGGIADRFGTMNDDADYILVDGGRNDYLAGVPIGTNADTTIDTFKGALNVLCQGLIDKYIGKKIIFVTCWNVNDDMMAYSDAMLETCGRWSIKCIDASRDSGVYMRSLAFRTQYCINQDDVSHLNGIGHDYVLPFFESQISSN
ncbi:SGNH/GDSL hydrolase family protein [Clostridium pasteurianum]|uniref:GDSL-like Lipase/Acylhydrolase n=1 Tax=Clostridium pasteurianum BC1 TaxID=86416 RepID=R4KEX4_CLOPA|nr:SGNH/GDSL hydrolase family protein [Clostridium pasteurianum]AGK98160.1 GDSL-like Lipase/Acylhydrolase [Clostridium pasteurianum BC1]